MHACLALPLLQVGQLYMSIQHSFGSFEHSQGWAGAFKQVCAQQHPTYSSCGSMGYGHLQNPSNLALSSSWATRLVHAAVPHYLYTFSGLGTPACRHCNVLSATNSFKDGEPHLSTQ